MRILTGRIVAVVLIITLDLATGAQAAGRRIVQLPLIAGQTDANDHLNFNGYAKGAMTITVPAGWTVVVRYMNNTAARHSLIVTGFTGKQPDKAVPPAFKGASTKDPVDGVGAGHAETITFVAERPGKYEFMCGVLGHAAAGMWDLLVVSPTAAAPSVQPRGAVKLAIK